ncbi:thyrotropin-releasing hormone receptor [Folsomia candida]|uniref:thyrotropin-releasing hormone receptor n=1 Tax=Folsomia candida TaxID=158441 RepID=UPI00160544CE|nr:thyrotropin-releasing hormone receptor [Folsomia candida]
MLFANCTSPLDCAPEQLYPESSNDTVPDPYKVFLEDPYFCLKGWIGRNDTPCEDPLYFSYNYRIVGTLFQGIVFLVGVFGNLMVVVVVARTKSMHSPTNCYLVSLALADSIVLLASVPQEIVSYYVVGNLWIWGELGCRLLIFLQHLGINVSSLSLAAFTVERWVAICKPFFAQTVCTVNRAKKIIAGVWIFALIYCFPWLFLTQTYPLFYKGFANIESCEYKIERNQYLGYYFTDLVVFYVIPLLLSVILYGLIARILYQSQNAKSSHHGTNGPLSVDSSKTNASRVQVVKMLCMVVIIFAILWLPYRGLLVYNSFAQEKFMDLWFLIFAKTCVFINSAINPILFNAMSLRFRTAFGRVLSCGDRRQRPRNDFV